MHSCFSIPSAPNHHTTAFHQAQFSKEHSPHPVPNNRAAPSWKTAPRQLQHTGGIPFAFPSPSWQRGTHPTHLLFFFQREEKIIEVLKVWIYEVTIFLRKLPSPRRYQKRKIPITFQGMQLPSYGPSFRVSPEQQSETENKRVGLAFTLQISEAATAL